MATRERNGWWRTRRDDSKWKGIHKCVYGGGLPSLQCRKATPLTFGSYLWASLTCCWQRGQEDVMSQSWEPGNVGDRGSRLDHKSGRIEVIAIYCPFLYWSIPLSVMPSCWWCHHCCPSGHQNASSVSVKYFESARPEGGATVPDVEGLGQGLSPTLSG